MFEGCYKFRKANVDTPYNKKHHLRTHIYTFKTVKTPYIIHVEEYPENIFILKFFRKQDRNRVDRFNIITNEGKCTRIVGICIRVLIDILGKNKNASFGFLGANSKNEEKDNSQRFRIYKFAMENLIGDDMFIHSMDLPNSTYLMVNRKNEKPESFVERAKLMFEEIYPQLEN